MMESSGSNCFRKRWAQNASIRSGGEVSNISGFSDFTEHVQLGLYEVCGLCLLKSGDFCYVDCGYSLGMAKPWELYHLESRWLATPRHWFIMAPY